MTKTSMKNLLSEHRVDAVISQIVWERIIIHFTIKVRVTTGDNLPLQFYMVSANGFANAELKVNEIRDDEYHVSINVTNPGYCRCLQSGTYTIVICHNDEALCIPTVSLELAKKLSSLSHMFLHSGQTMGYSVDFGFVEGDEDLHLQIRAQDMERDRNEVRWNPLDKEQLSRKEKLRKVLHKWLLIPKRRLIQTYYRFRIHIEKLKHGKQTVLFMSEQNETLKGNVRSVYERMKQRNLDQKYRILVSTRNMLGKGGYGILNWLHFVSKVASADILFVDDHCPFMDWLVLDKKTKVIQLWHAGAGYKSVGYSRWGHAGSPKAVCAHRQYDYGITPSHNIAFFFSEQFGINEEQILPTGMPRMDLYLDEDHKQSVIKELHEKYPQVVDKEVILFAPTYRGNNRKTAHYPYQMIDFDELYDACGDEYIVLFKMHPWVSEAVPIPNQYKDRFIDAGRYPDINDLYYITDLLITDYSSSVFEFSLMKKPMLFFAFDELQYEYSRGFHREYRPACPGRVCNTFQELLEAIRTKDFEFEKNEPYLAYHFDHFDSHASDRVIEWFVEGQLPAETEQALKKIQEKNQRLLQLDFSGLNWRGIKK